MNPSRDPFRSRVLWVTLAAAALLVLWQGIALARAAHLGVVVRTAR